jgi:hypothetical protein
MNEQNYGEIGVTGIKKDSRVSKIPQNAAKTDIQGEGSFENK